MNPESSASKSGAPHWDYIPTGFGRSGRSLSENNFAKERRNWLAILLREVLQNALDAKSPGAEHVHVSIRHVRMDQASKKYMATLIPPVHLDRFKQSVPHLQEVAEISDVSECLIVEDFGTSGLTGKTNDPAAEGKGQNWNAFWFREGEGGKENSSGNGGAGQGKITYFSTSAIRTLFAYTVRDDDKTGVLFGASSFLRDYPYEGVLWKRDAYWGLWEGMNSNRKALPVGGDDLVDLFTQQLGLQRKKHQCGLSLVLPSPKGFDEKAAIQIVIAEFFVPIVRGDLVVSLGGVTFDKASIMDTADQLLPDSVARQLHTCTTKGYRDFLLSAIKKTEANAVFVASSVKTATQLSEDSFKEEDVVAMREAIQNEDIVSVRIPLSIKPKSGDALSCHFDIHLACPFELDQPEQAVIRKDLLIGEEPIRGGKLRQRARALTLITSNDLSRLLLAAEEATHLRWNTRLPRLGEYYTSGHEAVALVRNATVRILDILTGGDQKKDFKLLSRYFSVPGLLSSVQARGKKSPKGKQIPIPSEIPPAEKRILVMEALEDGCRIRPSNAGAITADSIPIRVKVEFAYEGLDKDAFSEYDPLDFNLNDQLFTVSYAGCLVDTRGMNLLEFQIYEPDFELQVKGFDKNLRLRMRMNYEEKTDATAVNAE